MRGDSDATGNEATTVLQSMPRNANPDLECQVVGMSMFSHCYVVVRSVLRRCYVVGLSVFCRCCVDVMMLLRGWNVAVMWLVFRCYIGVMSLLCLGYVVMSRFVGVRLLELG